MQAGIMVKALNGVLYAKVQKCTGMAKSLSHNARYRNLFKNHRTFPTNKSRRGKPSQLTSHNKLK